MQRLAAAYGPWAVVAGGSEGVGAAFARILAEAGVNLVLAARKPGPLADTADACRARGVTVRTVPADLTEDGVDRIIEHAQDVEVGLLICNAGANTHSKQFLDGDLAQFQRVIDLNITAPLALVHHFGQAMRQRRKGGILMVGSLSGYAGSVRHTVYRGVKAFGQIFAEGLWLELREHGVHVLELVLGLTHTPAMERVGINFDVPGLRADDPEDVAREGLEQLANGPVWVAGRNATTAARYRDPNRAEVILEAHAAVTRLIRVEPAQS
ncbi:SDR family NAD(P)-dependent oxidoreductase [Mycobacterium sp.]|uniref:SDR family NAD(P)-dependent oxidoreductase n=1 Tax=Mycobacterium sp. TaxID=1785 RepID=UPI003F9E7977